jgi:hypothetical protein
MNRALRAAIRVQEIALCVVRKWWRPCICLGIAGSIINVGIVLPITTKTYPDLTGLAALIAAAAPFGVMRGLEKKWGSNDA